MGKLIVIEGTDGSGKSTQFRLLTEHLSQDRIAFEQLVFPQYSQPSSALIKMYLGGEFGSHPADVNAYAASTFYAVDRYASYKKVWGKWYEQGGLVVSDRYTTSNAVHQSSKLEQEALFQFSDWLFHYEYDLLGLPRPTCVIFLDLPPEASFRMLQKRQGAQGDIHELDHAYLIRCHQRALELCAHYGWHRIACWDGTQIRSIDSIHREIMEVIFRELQE